MQGEEGLESAKRKETKKIKGAFEEVIDRVREEMDSPALKNELSLSYKNEVIEQGSLVLARYDRYPWWPCVDQRIRSLDREDGSNIRQGDKRFRCRFLGEERENWVQREFVMFYSDERRRLTTVRESNIKFNDYNDSVEEAERLNNSENIL